MRVLWLDDPSCRDVHLVGGKAASLAHLAPVFPVPAGFCVPAGTAVVSAAALDAAYERLGRLAGVTDPAVAVRSSAVDEDGQTASFAGQHETFLNVVDAEAVAVAVARCFASAHSDRASDYRHHRGLGDAYGVAALVQLLIPADVSAVVFSADPVTGARGRVIVNASWGLGESVVSGTVTPDSFVVDKWTGEVADRRIGSKERMTVCVPSGTAEVGVPKMMRLSTCLDDRQVAEATAMACALEEATGAPVDVECAWEAGRLHLLQCRPITTLAREGSAT